MSNAETQKLIDEGIAYLKLTTTGYKGHTPTWYANPTTNWALGLGKLLAARKALDAAPAPTPGGYTIAAPVEPITRIVDAATVSLNIYGPGATTKRTDFEITRGGETAVMVLPEAPGTTLSRIRAIDVAAGWTSAMSKPHALYAKSLNCTVEDYWASTSPNVQGDCFSLRMAGTVLRRFHGEGAHAHLLGYFQEKLADGTMPKGTVLIENGTGTFKGDTAMWIDVNSGPYVEQAFVLRNLDVTGPGAFLVKASPLTWRGTMRIENCTLNGKPVTAAMVSIPSGLTIV